MASVSDRNPRDHTQNMKKRFSETMKHLREDIGKVDEPQLKAMFETSAELGGLVKAFDDYEKKNEAALAEIIPSSGGRGPFWTIEFR